MHRVDDPEQGPVKHYRHMKMMDMEEPEQTVRCCDTQVFEAMRALVMMKLTACNVNLVTRVH